MVSIRSYFWLSLIVYTFVIFHGITIQKQFFSLIIWLRVSKIAISLLTNLLFASLLYLTIGLLKLFFNEIREIEITVNIYIYIYHIM